MKDLPSRPGIAVLALEFTILTATRTNEILQAQWSEFNLQGQYWLIAGRRMKGKKDHKIPLSPRCVEILGKLHKVAQGPYVFPGRRLSRPLSSMALLMIIRRMQLEITMHGCRSSFRDWAGETTNYPRDIVELVLAHVNKDRVEAAYCRGDGFLKRQKLMNELGKILPILKRGDNTALPKTTTG